MQREAGPANGAGSRDPKSNSSGTQNEGKGNTQRGELMSLGAMPGKFHEL